MLKEETGVALFDEVRHLITVAADTRETKGQGLDEDETVSLEVTGHAEEITHIVILGFFAKWYLTDEVVTIDRMLYRICCRTNNIQFYIMSFSTKKFERFISYMTSLTLEVFANEEDLVVRLRLWAN